MSPVFDRPLLRRWFHLPAFAVIALAATTAYVADRGLDTWSAWKHPTHEREARTIELVGEGKINHVPVSRVSWSLTIDASAKTEHDAVRLIGERRQLIIQKLLDAGIARTEIDVGTADLSETTEYIENPRSWQSRDEVVSHEATQLVSVESTRVAVAREAFGTLALEAPTWAAATDIDCYASDTPELRKQTKDAAWADQQRLAEQAMLRIGKNRMRAFAVNESSVDIAYLSGTQACAEGLEARATVGISYEVR